MNSSINKKSTNNTTIYEDSSNDVMNCDSLSSSFEEIIIETDSKEEIPSSIGRYEKYNYKRYGRNILSFYRRKE